MALSRLILASIAALTGHHPALSDATRGIRGIYALIRSEGPPRITISIFGSKGFDLMYAHGILMLDIAASLFKPVQSRKAR